MLEREKFLAQKNNLLQRELEVWASQEEILGSDECIAVTVAIRKKSQQKPDFNTERFVQEDWNRIFSIPWSNGQGNILRLFRLNDNKPRRTQEISRIYPVFEPRTDIELINAVLREYSMPYRIENVAHGIDETGMFQILKTL